MLLEPGFPLLTLDQHTNHWRGGAGGLSVPTT